ncbi:putative membrane protein [Rhodopirellula maiorica SM1]|uniref:Putative membrane protein n=1 Tax=Rhodopirellula maiorica SM1 TaxID=1265738 RepID=M5S4C3_9BACT|nr:putative membrane protein [Rhodopirellula maiorica SM1]
MDGILFHQLLQLHNMLSAKFPVRDVDIRTLAINLEINMFWDGLFHVFTWIMTAIGIAMLWAAVRRSDVPLTTPTFLGSLSLGWGLFNLVEGIIDHHILHVHHVTETSGHLIWDLTFLAAGLVLILLGVWMIHHDRPAPENQTAGSSGIT